MNKTVFYYDLKRSKVVECKLIVKRRRTVDLLSVSKPNEEIVETKKVSRDLIATSYEDALSKFRLYQEANRQNEEEKQAAHRLHFDSYTMAYFRENDKATLLQIMESKAKTFVVFDRYGVKRIKMKTSFIRLDEHAKIFYIPNPGNIQVGNTISFYYQQKSIEAEVVTVHSQSIRARSGTLEFNIPKRLCRKMYRKREDWMYDELSSEIMLTRSSRVAKQISDYLTRHRIPSVVKYDYAGSYSVCTSERYHMKAINLLQESGEVKNALTGRTVQAAKWAL